MKLSSFSFFGLFVGLGLVACTVENGVSPGGSSAGGASSGDVDRCKTSCDKMKFFDCSSAEEQARCYADCDKATPSQIQVFAGCAENSICDPSCRTTIQPKDAPKEGTGGSASTCATACEKLTSCSFIALSKKDACISECTSKGYQYQVDCVNKNACDKIASACGGGEGGGTPSGPTIGIDASVPDFTVTACQDACDSLNFFACVSSTEHSTCRTACTTSTESERKTFTSCSDSSGSQCDRKKACLDTFLK